jgi:hypothetical protein
MLDIFLSIYGYSEEEEEEMEYTGQDYYYESCAQSTACDFMMPFMLFFEIVTSIINNK